VKALDTVIACHNAMMKEANHAESAWSADTIRLMNEATGAFSQLKRVFEALDCRCLLSNPLFMKQLADHLDCGGSCENLSRDYDTGKAECHAGFCPNDVAETLRSLAEACDES